jgi:3-hydroxyisobutyrate dehydrogenase-like beta-hydroxyacid dehydrogenase
MDIGFIGLGGMGKVMAANLVKAGHTVRVWNRSPHAVEELVRQGARAAATAREAFAGDAVISMLADDNAARSVIIDGGLLEHAARGLMHVNMATLSVRFVQELAALHRTHGVDYIAAPVFGRPDAAAAAKLHIVCAGDPRAIDRVQPLFDVLGQRTWRFGDEPHRANVIKVTGNFMIASVIELLGESTAMAKAYGINPDDLIQLLTGTLFGAPAFNVYGPLVAQQKFEPAGFKLQLGLKDVRLALEAGEGVHAPLPIASIVRDSLLDAVAHGDAEKDWSALSRVAYRRAGLAS